MYPDGVETVGGHEVEQRRVGDRPQAMHDLGRRLEAEPRGALEAEALAVDVQAAALRGEVERRGRVAARGLAHGGRAHEDDGGESEGTGPHQPSLTVHPCYLQYMSVCLCEPYTHAVCGRRRSRRRGRRTGRWNSSSSFWLCLLVLEGCVVE
jgi:hypothetical protein